MNIWLEDRFPIERSYDCVMKRILISEVENKITMAINRAGVCESYKYNKRDLNEMLEQVEYQLGLMECFDSKSPVDVATKEM